jgi:hypothetical protein
MALNEENKFVVSAAEYFLIQLKESFVGLIADPRLRSEASKEISFVRF